MKWVVAGGTGFIGEALVRELSGLRDEVVVLTRSPRINLTNQPLLRYVLWDPFAKENRGLSELEAADGVINLTGESIAKGRWNPARKKRILASRTAAVRTLSRAIVLSKNPPGVFLNASAVGYYGDRGDEILDENSDTGTGFLSEVCREWENEVANLAVIRTVRIRIGMVIHPAGGALRAMLPVFRWGLGGPLGSGRQWISWIHRDDLVALILFLLGRKDADGVFNATSPDPVRMKDFSRSLGSALHRPAVMALPAWILKIFLGEMASLLLSSQRVLPKRAQEAGFVFRYPSLTGALRGIS